MNNWQVVSQRASPLMWTSAGAVSLVLLIMVLSQVDWSLFIEILLGTLPAFVVLSIALFLLEGVFTSLRFYLLTPGDRGLAACFSLTAWYVVLLILLPLRLGEVVVVLLLKKYLDQDASPALMNVLVQRLFDLVTLCVVFLACMLFFSSIFESTQLKLLALLCLLGLSWVLTRLDKIIALPAWFLSRHGVPKAGKLRVLLRTLLQARTWYRHRLTLPRSSVALVLSLGKWLCNLLAFVFLLQALQLPVDFSSSLVIAAAYNFLTIVPVQTIGGIGLSEVGLSGLLVFSGLPLVLAASATILVRVVVIMIPFLFWVLVMSVTRFSQAQVYE